MFTMHRVLEMLKKDLRNIDANTQLTSLGARLCVLEEELAWAASERSV